MRVCSRCHLQYPDGHAVCFVDGAPLHTVRDERIGTLVGGRYLVEGVIGTGAMAVVYRARNRVVGQPVAVKVMSPGLSTDPVLRERFRREAKNTAALPHPNIVEIYDYGETDDGCAYLVMQLLNGVPLSHLAAKGPMDALQVVTIAVQAARGLSRVHDFGIVHRDLKPENIYICDAGAGKALVKLLDFGIAVSSMDERLTAAGQIFGTPQYMAPERAKTSDIGPQADLYSLGIILFELVTGQLPFDAQDIPTYFLKHLEEAPPRPRDLAPSCPPLLEDLILKLLEKEPEERPVDAHAVLRLLASIGPGESKFVLPVGPPSVETQWAPTVPEARVDVGLEARVQLLSEMLVRAYPDTPPPGRLLAMLRQIEEQTRAIGEHRERALSAQRVIEAAESRSFRERQELGQRAHAAAEDLSSVREAARAARRDLTMLRDSEQEGEAAYRLAAAHLVSRGDPRRVAGPERELIQALTRALDAAEAWRAAQVALEQTQSAAEELEVESARCEAELVAVRAQLEGLDDRLRGTTAPHEERVREAGRRIEALEVNVIETAGKYCDALRPRSELKDLFAALEGT